jgi:hypothetical protein
LLLSPSAELLARAVAITAAHAEMRRREESLLDFLPRHWPGLISPRHLAPLANLFERVVRGERVRALVSVPAQHGKTTLLLAGIAWLLRRQPTWPVAYVTYAQDQADTQSILAQRVALSAGAITGSERQTLRTWSTPRGGSAFFTGVGGPLTGNPARLLLIDDPYKNRIEADSPLTQSRVEDYLTSVGLTRLPEDGSAISVHTRWNENDLNGRLGRGEIGAGDWETVNLPFLSNVSGEADDTGDVVLWPREQLATGAWVGWTPEGARQRLREVGPHDAASIYQGHPRPRGGTVYRQPDRCLMPHLTGSRLVIGADCAGTDGPLSNHSVFVALAVRGYGETMTADVAGILRLKLRPEHAAPPVLAWQRSFGGTPLHIEATRDGRDLGAALQRIAPGLAIAYVGATGDKFLRAQPSAAAWNAGRIRVPVDARTMRSTTDDDLSDFVRVTTRFTGMGDAHDDDVDALSHAWSVAQTPAPVNRSVRESDHDF